MGNTIAFEVEGEDDDLDVTWSFEGEPEDDTLLHAAIGNVVGQIMGSLQSPNSLPIIRKKPDLRTFRHTPLYKEVKALCGLPATCKQPNDNWSLQCYLMKRENGVGPLPGAFSQNQQRRIANMFVPNSKDVRLMSLESKVYLCKFNRDGSKLITASQDAIVRLFDSSKGTYHRINRIWARNVNWSILDLDFSPCGQLFAYSTWNNSFFVAPLDEEDARWETYNIDSLHRVGMFSVRFTPCGRHLIGGCNDTCVYLCDRETKVVQRVRTIKERNFSNVDINAVSFLSEQDNNCFVTGCNDGKLKLWDRRVIAEGEHVSAFFGHLDGITYIDPRNDGNYVLTNSKDQSIKIWDLRHPTPNSKINTQPPLPLLSWDYRWDSVPRGYYNSHTTLDGDVSIMTYRGHRVSKSLLRAKFSPAVQTGQRYIYTGCSTGRIVIYDVLTGTIKEAIEGHRDIVRDLAWHPIRPEIVSSSWDSHVNLNTFKRTAQKRPAPEPIPRPLRRSRRIARQNGELCDEDED